MKRITLFHIERLAHRLARKLMSYNEPIPDFSTRFPNVLESCINQPFQKVNKQDAYRGVISKAAILFYLMIKNHPFQNGNKRIAITTILVFFFMNKKWIKVADKSLYRFAVDIAKSSAKDKVIVMQNIENFLKDNVIDLK